MRATSFHSADDGLTFSSTQARTVSRYSAALGAPARSDACADSMTCRAISRRKAPDCFGKCACPIWTSRSSEGCGRMI